MWGCNFGVSSTTSEGRWVVETRRDVNLACYEHSASGCEFAHKLEDLSAFSSSASLEF